MLTLIQIGCNIGLDRVYDSLKETQDHYDVFLIEANQFSLEKCKNNYNDLLDKHNIYFLNAAIVPNNTTHEEIVLYYPKENPTSPFVSTNKDFVITHQGTTDIDSFSVRSIPINDLLSVYGDNREIEYLYIDTEGLCVDIVDCIDFDTYNIKNLVFEYIHSDGTLSWGGPKLANLLERLQKRYLIREEDYDIVASKHEKT